LNFQNSQDSDDNKSKGFAVFGRVEAGRDVLAIESDKQQAFKIEN